ncbi:MAG: HNH endonuclease [Ilumatobacter sp.]
MATNQSRRARASRKRQRRMKRVEHDLTDDQWNALQHAWGGCAYCMADNVAMQRDCVQALSRGGRYTLDNIVPACRSCNASKSNDEVTGWMRRKKLDERSFLVRHYEIGAEMTRRFVSVEPAPESASNGPDADGFTSAD